MVSQFFFPLFSGASLFSIIHHGQTASKKHSIVHRQIEHSNRYETHLFCLHKKKKNDSVFLLARCQVLLPNFFGLLIRYVNGQNIISKTVYRGRGLLEGARVEFEDLEAPLYV